MAKTVAEPCRVGRWGLLLYAFCNGLWGKQTRDARKGNQKGGKQIGEWPKPNTPIPQTFKEDPAGKAYARSDWALKTNERSVAKQIPLLGEFSSYIEWEKEAKDGPERYIITR